MGVSGVVPGLFGLGFCYQDIVTGGQDASEDVSEAFPFAEEGLDECVQKAGSFCGRLALQGAVHGLEYGVRDGVVGEHHPGCGRHRFLQLPERRDGGDEGVGKEIVIGVEQEPVFVLTEFVFVQRSGGLCKVKDCGEDGAALGAGMRVAVVSLPGDGFRPGVSELAGGLETAVVAVQEGGKVIGRAELVKDGLGAVAEGYGRKVGFEEPHFGVEAPAVYLEEQTIEGHVFRALGDDVCDGREVSYDSHRRLFFCFDSYLDGFRGLAPFLVHDVGVDLRGGDVGVREEFGDGVDGSAVAGQDGGVGVAEVMEGDVLVDAGSFYPAGDAAVEGAAVELVEDEAFLAFAQEAVGLFVDGDDGIGASLLGDDFEGIALVGGDDDVVPSEALDVGDAEAAEAGKEAGALDLLVFAGGGGQAADFLDGEVFLVDGGYGDGVQPGDDVVGDEFVALGTADDHLEVHPEVGGAVVRDEAFVIEACFSGEEVFAEFLAEFEGDVGDGAFAAGEAEEVLEGAAGIIPRFVGYVLEVLDEVHFATVAVGEAELLFEDGDLALGADCLGNL